MATKKRGLPTALVETRPALAEDPTEQHPANGVPLGRIPKLYSRGVHDKICENIRAGNRAVVAAQMAGIPANTFYDWMQRGRANDPRLWEFAQDIELAEGEAEGAVVAVIKSAMPDDVDAAKFWLTSSRPGGWNKSAAAIAQGQIEDFMNRLESGLDPDTFAKVLAVAAGQRASLPPAVTITQIPEPTSENGNSEEGDPELS